MTDVDTHFQPVEYGLNHAPLVRTSVVEVERPSLRDNTGLVERLARAIKRTDGAREVDIPLEVAAGLDEAFRRGDWRVRVWSHHEPDGLRVVRVGPAAEPFSNLALAVDVGSTTLVLALVDLEQAVVLDRLTRSNPQAAFGADILTRCHFAEQPGGLGRLVSGMREAINQGAAELCARQGVSPSGIHSAALAGNTTMTHFLLGLSPRTIIREPYVPVVNIPAALAAPQIGLEIAPTAPVLVLPNKGAYFGGDLLAGIIVAGLGRSERPSLMVDVGTNAEVVLGQRDWLIGAAGAAGPALEGGVARMGVVASPGAVDRVRIDRESRELTCRTIGGQPATGICGSGLIDLFAELYLSGIIDFHGKLTLPAGHPRRVETDEGPAFVVVPAEETAAGEPILLSEVEIDILTRSKAAMYTILSTVMKSVGLTFDQLEHFYVAGTFGQYIDPRMAVAVGMLPDIPLDRYVPLGNSSLKGAVLALLSSQARAEVMDVWRKLTYLEMNVNQDLMNRFSAARFIPHTDRSRFPSVGTLIR